MEGLSEFSIAHAAEQAPEHPFVVRGERQWSYAELARRVEALLASQAGCELSNPSAHHRPIALVATNDLQTLVRCLAAFELGRPLLLLHPRWSEHERAGVLARAGLSEPLATGEEASASGRDIAGATPAAPALPDPALLAIVFTSGSSGTPKGVMLTRAALAAAARASAANLGWRAQDRWLLSLPLAHVGGLSILTRCLAARATVVLPTDCAAPFDARRFAAEVARSSTTLLSLVPTQLKRVVEAGVACPPSVRAVLVGGASLTQALRRRAQALGWPLLSTYGMTETGAQVATERYRALPTRTLGGAAAAAGSPEQSERPDGVCGPPLEGIELRIAPHGVIEVRSPTLFSGYFPDEPAPLDARGWFRTNDLGQRLENGELRVLGRVDDVIISGGENVHPQQVEQVLLGLPGVTGACVFGLPSEDWGELVAAAVVSEQLDLAGLRAEARVALGPIKCPKRWLLVENLPLNPNGKLDRQRARTEFGPRCQ